MTKNNLRKAWIDQGLIDEIDRLAKRMQDELGEGKKTTASRLLASGIRKARLVDDMEFVSLPKKKRVLGDDGWGWKI